MSFRHYDDYDDYDFNANDRKARRQRKVNPNHKPKKAQHEIVATLGKTEGIAEAGFQTTYQPSRHEEGWLLQSLRDFYDQNLISDVLAVVKGGKEASVYRAEAHPTAAQTYNMPFLAAKVYRPSEFRQIRNDSMYREGRNLLKSNGKIAKVSDERMMRAIGKKSAYGQQIAHTSWLMHEFTTMQRLHAAGANVPLPIASSENAILMQYFGDEHMPAPTLSEVTLDPDEVPAIFRAVVRNIELMLSQGVIHGDLSAYNMLYWEGQPIVIDFPQVVPLRGNSHAQSILRRDVERVCDYFADYGIQTNAAALARTLWTRHAQPNSRNDAADISRLIPED